jgi:uncharacterized protein (TIGR02145 family)
MKKVFALIVILFVIGFFGCSKEIENPEIADTILAKPSLSAPANQSVYMSVAPRLSWAKVLDADTYKLEIASDTSFNNIIFSQDTLTTNYKIVTGLSHNANYYWRVYAKNSIGWSSSSETYLFSTIASANIGAACPGVETICDNRNGKFYNTVMIGSQCWLKENLNVGTDEKCYDNNTQNCDAYGGLFYSADLNKTTYQAICPTGWHLPSKEEFQILFDTVVTTNSLKAVGQGSGNGQGTNSSGFSALLSGYLTYPNTFMDLGTMAGYWTSTTQNGSHPDIFTVIYCNDGNAYFNNSASTEYAVSVRCIKD